MQTKQLPNKRKADNLLQKLLKRFKRNKTVDPLSKTRIVLPSSIGRAHTPLANKNVPSKFATFGKLLFGFMGLIVIVLVILSVREFIISDNYKVKNWKFFGNQRLTSQELLQSVNEFSNQNIFIVNSNSIINKLESDHFYIQAVYIRKQYPDTIFVQIVEREPKLTLINLTGAYLVDEQGDIISSIIHQKVEYTEEELLIMKGLGNINSDYIRNKLLPSTTPSLVFNLGSSPSPSPTIDPFVQIDPKVKIYILKQLQAELDQKAEESFTIYANKVSTTEFANLLKVYAYSQKEYLPKDHINKELLANTLEVSLYFARNNDVSIIRLTWVNDYSLSAQMSNNKFYIFGISRPISEQLEDLGLIINRLNQEGKNFSKIDVSTKKISVE